MQKLTCALLVDDDPTTNYLNNLLLKRLAVTDNILVATNGEEALEMLLLHCHNANPDCPALILLDVKMPVMDGFAFLAAYDELPLAHREAIIIVMLTTSLHPQDLSRMQKLNIAGFLNKPLTREKVNSILENHFNRHLPTD